MNALRFLAVGAVLLAGRIAVAAEPPPFYQGKDLQFLIRAEPGGSYDLYMRTLAKYMVRHIPGAPTATPVNMPGGGGLQSLTYLDKRAPHDGTALIMVTQTAPLEQALGTNANLKTDLGTLNWIGNVSQQNTFLVLRASSPTRSIEDAKSRVTLLAASGGSGSDYILGRVLNAILRTKLKSILGYRSSPEMDMAIHRGEAEGRFTTSLRGLFGTDPKGANAFRLILQIGVRPDPTIRGAPLLTSLKSDQPRALAVISKVMSFGRPVATNSGVPADRVAILRQAFDDTMRDPGFLDEMRRQQLDVSPWSGDQSQSVVSDILSIDPVSKAVLQKALSSAGAR